MKALASRMAAVVLLAAAGAMATAQNNINVVVDGQSVNFRDVQPMMMQGRVFVPLRGVFEQMGADVYWNAPQNTVTATRGARQVRLQIGDTRADVDGRQVMLDSPARLVQGRTMVPLRFISEALGAEVTWHENRREVAIQTRDSATIVQPPATMPPAPSPGFEQRTLEENTVLPVRLNTRLDSEQNRVGDRFFATIDHETPAYAFIPQGARVEGEIVAARPREGNEPGIMELRFRRMVMPDGRTYAMNGSLIGLDDEFIERRQDGMLIARPARRDQRMVYAGYGAAAGVIMGVLTDRPLEKGLIGGVLGYLLGGLERREAPRNVVLEPGTRFGVRLDENMSIMAGRQIG
jgi:hypothetical protein